ncbi:hypothetical protein N0V93_004374 [Gnomoniopsis smithogilvyi]|uniref:Uncharacterized protein n=1 Tax=Gnomoniopsis smithogilvyi TaxID=1191159 RepID=A0A9W8YQZ1_9PEZI|nr:hypothetical protein N0V93_004374 [Gnomoniopsis smithogilvyi]
MGMPQSTPRPTPPPVWIPTELQELHGLCIPEHPPKNIPLIPIPFELAGVRPENATAMDLSPDNKEWIRALRIIQKALDKSPAPSLQWFTQRSFYSRWHYDAPRRFNLASVASILFDQECSGIRAVGIATSFSKDQSPSDSRPKRPAVLPYWAAVYCIQPILEHMLLVDYGFGAQPLVFRNTHGIDGFADKVARPHFNSLCLELVEAVEQCRTEAFPLETLESLKNRLWPFETPSHAHQYRISGQCFADLSLMIYWFYTRRREISIAEYTENLTGYTGVVQEMIEQVPQKGPGRLKRKLLADIHFLIPVYVRGRDRQTKVVKAAEDLATRFGISTAQPGMGEPNSQNCTGCDEVPEPLDILGGSGQAAGEPSPPAYREAMNDRDDGHPASKLYVIS